MTHAASRYLATLPLTAPAAVSAFGAVGVALLVLGRLDSTLVWPLGLAAALAATVVIHRCAAPVVASRPSREQRVCDVLVVVLVLGWGLVNAHHSSQNIFVYRDPGIYAVTGAWLIEENHLELAKPTVFGDVAGVEVASAGFGPDVHHDDRLFAQGVHLLPTLLGMAGRIGGASLMLKLNPVLGAVALLAVYGFARLLARPRSALLATSALALSLPLIYFSRDAYTEPLSAAMVFGALAILWVAHRSGAAPLWFLAGFVAGSGALLRADGYLAPIVLTGYAAVLVALTGEGQRSGALRRAGLLLVGAGTTSMLGWLDAAKLSSGYYHVHGVEIRQQLLLWAAILAATPLLIWVGWRTSVISRLDRSTRRWRGPAAAAAIVLVAVVLASRPLWMVSYDAGQGGTIAGLVAGLQEAAGDPVEPTRNYAESSATWLVWYLGPVLVLLAVAGLAISTARLLRPGGAIMLPAIAVVAGTSLVFLVLVGITPDHVWVMRRFLPVTMPGLAVFAAVGLDGAAQLLRGRQPHTGVATVVLGIAMLAGPLAVSRPFLLVREYVPQLNQMREICDALPADAAVVWPGWTGNVTIRSVEVFCDVPTAWVEQPDAALLESVAANVRAAGKVPVLAVVASEGDVLPDDLQVGLREVSRISYERFPNELYGPPRTTDRMTRTVLLGVLEPGRMSNTSA